MINISIKEPILEAESDSIPNKTVFDEKQINYRIVISDSKGTIYDNFLTSKKSFDFSVSHLKNGIYTIIATKGESSSSTQFIVSK